MHAETTLPAVQVDRTSRIDATFSSVGELIEDIDRSGRFPVFTGGAAFEIWASFYDPSPVDITITLYKFAANAPETPIEIHSTVVPAGTYIHVDRFTDHVLARGDQITVTATLGSGLVTDPGTELTIVVRIS